MQLRAGRALHIGSARAGSASSRRADKSGREAPQDSSWRFRRAGLKFPRHAPTTTPTSPRTVAEPPTPSPRGRRHRDDD